MKILVVDDEPLLRECLLETIRNQGFEVFTAENGLEGLTIFDTFHPDLIFSDIQMPKMNGLEFLSAIRERSLDAIVVMITGLGKEEFTLEALRRHANDFLRKPIRENILLPLLEKYSQLVENRTRFQETLNLFVSRNFVIQFDNEMRMIPEIARRLMCETRDAIAADQRLGTQIGLVELMANAIEHGNLGISYEEKLASMATSTDGIDQLQAERLKNPDLSKRKVTVAFSIDRESCSWTISDEGDGFDWKSLPDPRDLKNIANPNGRGIFLAKLNFDHLEFFGKGNKVRVKKLLRPPAK